jgi:hypothetical protein
MKKVFSTIKTPCCNNPNTRTTTKKTNYNTEKQQKEHTKTARGWIQGASCSGPWPITFDLVGGMREIGP